MNGNKIVATVNFRSYSVVEEMLSVDENLLTLLDLILVLVCKLVAVEIVTSEHLDGLGWVVVPVCSLVFLAIYRDIVVCIAIVCSNRWVGADDASGVYLTCLKPCRRLSVGWLLLPCKAVALYPWRPVHRQWYG